MARRTAETCLASVSEVIAARAADVWAILADFAHPQRLAPTILRCAVSGSGVGAIRVIESSRGLRIHERLVECDFAAGRFRYEILDDGDMPFAGVSSYDCTVTVEPRADGSTMIRWASVGNVTGPIGAIEEFLTTLYRGAIDRIRTAVTH